MPFPVIKILYLGDIFGEPGRRIVKHFVPLLRQKHQLDLVLANCENVSHGRGVGSKHARELAGSGVDFMTSGNHIYDVEEVYAYLNQSDAKVLRPYNLPQGVPGRGTTVVETISGVRVGLVNIMGSLFMNMSLDEPFAAADRAIEDLKQKSDVIVLDMHCDATSEKRAMGWHVAGRVQLVVGTHTHVPTADEEILPGGTAYITDLGMCGPYDSIIGMDKQNVLKKFRTGMKKKFEVAQGDVRLCGVICEIDVHEKKAVKLERVCERM